MMSALPQPATSPALATFLAAIGQAPATGGEGGSFSQLLAATPQSAPGAGAIPVIAKLELPQSIDGAILPTTDAIEIEATPKPVTAKDAVPADTAAATAASLLIAIAGAGAAAPGTKPTPTQPTGTAPETDGEASAEAGAAIAIAVAEPAVPVATWSPIVAAPPPAGKPAKSVDTAAAAADDMLSSVPTAAKQAPAPLPSLAALSAEPLAAKAAPADAGASMTVLFTQPATQGAAPLGETVQPAIVTERTLDIGSDDAWIEQLAHDIAATKSTTGDVSFRLMPRHLGRLDVAMQMGDEGVSLKLDTQHEATAVIVTAAQARLVEDLRQQGVRVAGAEVTCTPGETGRQSQQGQGRGAAQDAAHLIETATERAEPRDEDRAADRRGRFA